MFKSKLKIFFIIIVIIVVFLLSLITYLGYMYSTQNNSKELIEILQSEVNTTKEQNLNTLDVDTFVSQSNILSLEQEMNLSKYRVQNLTTDQEILEIDYNSLQDPNLLVLINSLSKLDNSNQSFIPRTSALFIYIKKRDKNLENPVLIFLGNNRFENFWQLNDKNTQYYLLQSYSNDGTSSFYLIDEKNRFIKIYDISNKFIEKVIQDKNNPSLFKIQTREGNGIKPSIKEVDLDLLKFVEKW
jgi:hypothetical protein